jgi:hypothetical protein
LRQWLNLVNNRPDDIPHLFIEGGSGTGKTTFTKAVLADRGGTVAIVGVKPDDEWGAGYIYHSAAREPALAALLSEVQHRLDQGDRSGITIVLDDFTRLAAAHPVAVELYKLIADVGRSLRIRLIMVARGRLVKALGARGESDLHEHFVFITLRRDHRATLEYDEQEYPLDTSNVPTLAQPIPPARWWTPPAAGAPPAAPTRRNRTYLSSLLEEDLTIAPGMEARKTTPAPAENFPPTEARFSAEESETTVSELAFSAEEIARIAAFIAGGKRKTEVLKLMPRYSGRKHSLYSAYYDRLNTAVHEVLQELEEGEPAERTG